MHELGESEVEHLHLSGRRQEDVGGFDVAMDDVLGVRRDQSVGDLDANIEHFVDIHRVTGDVLLEALAFEPLHDDEGMPVVVFDAVYRTDIGVVKQGCGPGFAAETLQGFGISGQVFRDEFQGDVPP